MAANDKQVGGTHYQQEGTPQHWDVAIALNWDYLVGAATKYLWRLGRKGDRAKHIEDVEKAIHYLQKKLEVMREEAATEARKGTPMRIGGLNVPMDFRGHYTMEGYRTNGEALYTCLHCKKQDWMTETEALEHLRHEHPKSL